MNKKIEVVPLTEVQDFIKSLSEKEAEACLKAFDKTEAGIKGSWFKKLTGTDIWEFRIDTKGKFYRILAFWDGEEENSTLIICTHGFAKKKNKTPDNQIKKAIEIKRVYFSQKNSS